MTGERINILLVEEKNIDTRTISPFLAEQNLPYDLYTANSKAEVLDHLKNLNFEIVILDYSSHHSPGLEILPCIKNTPAIFITPTGHEELAIKALKLGACDYLIRDPNDNYLTMLPSAIEKVININKIQEELQIYKDRMDLVLKGADLGLWDLNPMTGEMVFSDRWTEMLGYDSDKIKPHINSWINLTHPDDRPSVYNTLEDHIKGKIPLFEKEYRLRTKTGDWCWVLARGRVTSYDNDGRPLRITGTLFDITERKQAEKAMRIKEYAISSSINGIAMADMNGNLTYTNNSLIDMYQYPREEILGKNVTLFFESPGEPSEAIKTLKEKGTWIGELVAKKKDGSLFDILLSANMVKAETGEPICMMASIMNITDSKRLEGYLRQKQKMEGLGTLAGGISHDFNNLLTAIIGYAELTIMQNQGNEKICSNLEKVLQAGMQGKHLVKQVLAFSQQNSKERKPIDIKFIIIETLKFLRASLPTTIEIRQNIRTKSAMVFSDPAQIHQILMNLSINAAQAIHEKQGILEVTLDDENISAADLFQYPDLKPGPYLRLSIRDTGPGMAPEVKNRIFDPFFTTRATGEGTGMGLSVVHGIVKAHKGAITVSSRPGTGTTFHLLLPKYIKKTKAITDIISPVATGKGRVLYIDDQEAVADIGKQLLEYLGYEVEAETNSLKALETFRTKPSNFDLVITDLTMPNLTGIDLSKKLLQIRSDIPIILCTGYSEIIDTNKTREAGIREMLMKPFSINNLTTTVQKVLNKPAG